MNLNYYIGLDLGQAQDSSALAVVERSRIEPDADDEDMIDPDANDPDADYPDRPSVYLLRHLQRWPLGTSYPAIVQDVAKLAGRRPLNGRAFLGVDQTGVGRAVVDMLRRARLPCRLVPILITCGHTVTVGENGSRHIPKKELVSVGQALLQERRLKVSPKLPDAAVLLKELENFKVTVTVAANETFGAWREGAHDDLVLALAMAAWMAENTVMPYTGPVVYNDWAWPRDEKRDKKPKSRLQTIFEELGIDPYGDW